MLPDKTAIYNKFESNNKNKVKGPVDVLTQAKATFNYYVQNTEYAN